MELSVSNLRYTVKWKKLANQSSILYQVFLPGFTLFTIQLKIKNVTLNKKKISMDLIIWKQLKKALPDSNSLSTNSPLG